MSLKRKAYMDPRRLHENPFTDFDDQGVNGVFPAAKVKQLVQLPNDVKGRAAA